jgi:hypothetical protein
MALHASWVHGTAFAPAERPANGLSNVNGVSWTDVVGLRQGGGTTFQGQAGHNNWFHVSIPTPVIVNDVRARLKQVFVMFQCGDPNAQAAQNAGANVTDIHVWDGPNRIHTFGPFLLFGEHRFRLDTSNTLVMPAAREISWGIGLSVRVQFSAQTQVTFAAAGADFEF